IGSIVAIIFTLIGKRGLINWVVARGYAYIAGGAVGISYKVDGEEYINAGRPAIYICNHQSAGDLFVMGRIFPKNCVVISKSSLKFVPIMGTFCNALRAVDPFIGGERARCGGRTGNENSNFVDMFVDVADLLGGGGGREGAAAAVVVRAGVGGGEALGVRDGNGGAAVLRFGGVIEFKLAAAALPRLLGSVFLVGKIGGEGTVAVARLPVLGALGRPPGKGGGTAKSDYIESKLNLKPPRLFNFGTPPAKRPPRPIGIGACVAPLFLAEPERLRDSPPDALAEDLPI
ncbi:5778_t:CDS:2, partial [Acaulospora colombiana]